MRMRVINGDGFLARMKLLISRSLSLIGGIRAVVVRAVSRVHRIRTRLAVQMAAVVGAVVVGGNAAIRHFRIESVLRDTQLQRLILFALDEKFLLHALVARWGGLHSGGAVVRVESRRR